MSEKERDELQKLADRSLRRCALYFGILSFLIAGTIGLGNESWQLPILVGLAALIGYIYTDVLKWFRLHRFLVYVLMVVGAGLAAYQFLRDAGGDRLLSVGNLLVYVQLPLIFQKKDKRVFEQWGVFLLLELVVAALVNDNVLYGIMLLPVLAIGGLAMLSLTQFATQEKHNQTHSATLSLWTRFLHWIGRESTKGARPSGIRLTASPVEKTLLQRRVERAMRLRWSAWPITLGVLLFTLAYFYSLPRLHVGAYESNSWFSASVGFSEQVSLRYQGDVRLNDTPVLRMQMTYEGSGLKYLPSQPPYIRLSVLHSYKEGPNHGYWQKGDAAVIVEDRFIRKAPQPLDIDRELRSQSDPVVVSVIEKLPLGEMVAAIPPFSLEPTQPGDFYANRRDWRLMDMNDFAKMRSSKRRYSFRTYGYSRSDERRVLPDIADSLDEPGWNELEGGAYRLYRRASLTEFPTSLNGILPLRDEILKDSGLEVTQKVARAIFLERYFAGGREYRYTLRLTPLTDPTLDPIVDFLLNKKEGHCEYFASSFAILLRSMNIPTRLVSGFRPSDYNELGGYIEVQQKHAHVWVEAYFTVDELKAHNIWEEVPSYITHGAWMRFDPTPAGEGSNAGIAFKAASGQTMGFMQDLWSEMILNMDKSRQGRMFTLFGEVSESSYDDFFGGIQRFIAQLQSSRIIGGLASPEKWFSWRAAMLIILTGALVLGGHRMASWFFPNWAPQMGFRWRRGEGLTEVEFYNRVVKALRRLGYERAKDQTPREFLIESLRGLDPGNGAGDGAMLADSFYRLRYGASKELEQEVLQQIDAVVQHLGASKV